MANAITEEADWISLMDYATQYGVSLSTLRRHIKANKLQFKVEHGRYLLRSPFMPAMPTPRIAAQPSAGLSPDHTQSEQELLLRLQSAQEEIAELKMLVALYEEQLSQERPGQLRVNGY